MKTHRKSQVALVLSAPAKVTNYLVELVSEAVKGNDVQSILDSIEAIYVELIQGIKLKYPNVDDDALHQILNEEFSLIKKRVQGIMLLGQCPDNVQAKILSRGEKLSAVFMENLLKARGENVTRLCPVEVLKTSEGGYLESTVNIDLSRSLLQSVLEMTQPSM